MKPVITAADPARGRFRAFLRADCGFYLGDCRDHEQAWKRGGGRHSLSIDARDAEGRYVLVPADNLTADRLFDRAGALTLLGRALDRLGAEYAATGRGALFERLQGFLTGGSRMASFAQIATELDLTEPAVHQAASRLRKRYRQALRDEIAATLNERADVFALGSILCEILTGEPAFVGRKSAEILRKSGHGDTADALARLAACGTDAELSAWLGTAWRPSARTGRATPRRSPSG
ncbi:MAG: RNA polymerase sigma factor [Isosphaeraceae bacterium]